MATTTSAHDGAGPALPLPVVTPPSHGPSTMHVPSQTTVPLDTDDAAAVGELLSAYRESLTVQGEATAAAAAAAATADSTSMSDCASLMPVQLRCHAAASSISDLVNVAELSVRRVIAMAKQVPTLLSTARSYLLSHPIPSHLYVSSVVRTLLHVENCVSASHVRPTTDSFRNAFHASCVTSFARLDYFILRRWFRHGVPCNLDYTWTQFYPP